MGIVEKEGGLPVSDTDNLFLYLLILLFIYFFFFFFVNC